MSDTATEISALDSFTAEIKEEQPSIEYAVKNMISLLVGNGALELNDALFLAKSLLQVIQRTSLMTLESYLEKFPQRESQSGLDRLDEVCRYKAVVLLRHQVIEHKAKINKLFGRKYFSWTNCWPLIRSETVAAATSGSVDEETSTLFLQTFENSLAISGEVELSDYSDLIWSMDFNGNLVRRKEKRLAEVTRRLGDLAALDEAKVMELTEETDNDEHESKENL